MVGLENIKLRALVLRSSIHNERSYTATEASAMLAKKTNELIDVVNELADYIQTLEVSVQIKYDELTESLNIG